MNVETKEKPEAQSEEEDIFDETATLTIEGKPVNDNVGDTSVEINVDELISEVEAAGLPTDHFKGEKARKKLDEILEERRISNELSDFEDFELD